MAHETSDRAGQVNVGCRCNVVDAREEVRVAAVGEMCRGQPALPPPLGRALGDGQDEIRVAGESLVRAGESLRLDAPKRGRAEGIVLPPIDAPLLVARAIGIDEEPR